MTTEKTSLEDNIKCPSCGEDIPVSQTLVHQLTEEARNQVKAEIAADKKVLVDREKELAAREKDLTGAKEDLSKLVEEKVKEGSAAIQTKALEKAKLEVALELKDLREEADEREKKLQEAQKAEFEIRREKKNLEDKRRNLELEIERKLDQERKAIRETVAKEFSEEHRLRDAEKDKRVNDMLQQIEELKRKAQQGSQQAQGEVLELEMEDFLRANFPFDTIEPVPKGLSGADVLQTVHNRLGQRCGMIIWESKRTKTWSDGWVQKLKDDQREAKADIAVIVTETMPKDIQHFGQRNGVWVTDYRSMLGLASVIRVSIENVALAKVSAVNMGEKMEVLYGYLSGPEFRQKVEAIVEAFVSMQQDLEKEKRQYTKSWAKREKQIQRVIQSTAGMYGEMQGIIGSSMQSIPALEAGEEDESIGE